MIDIRGLLELKDTLMQEFNISAKGKVFNSYTNMYKTPELLEMELTELIFNPNKKVLVLKGGRGSGKSTASIHLCINLMLFKDYANRNIVFGGWKKEDTKETFNKLKIEVKRLKEDIRDSFLVNDTNKTIMYKPNNTTVNFIPLTDFIGGGTKIQNLNRLKALNNVALWVIDEAIFITKDQLDIMYRTSRENPNALLDKYKGDTLLDINSNSKMIFLLNPSKPNGDDVVNYFVNREDATIKHVNIMDLSEEYRSAELIAKMEEDKKQVELGNMMQEDYNHIWHGEPQYLLHYQPFRDIKFVNYALLKDKIAGSKWYAYMDVAYGGGDNCVLMLGIKIIDEYYIIGYSFKESVTDRIEYIKNKLSIFGNPQVHYENNNAKTLYKVFKDAGITPYSKSQRKNKEEKVASVFNYASKITFLKVAEKENLDCFTNIINYNPTTSKHDDEVDALSEVLLFVK